MRRILIFLTIFQLSTGNLLGNELMKLPVLVRHYQLYRATCGEGCWVDFLRLHYANTRHRSSDPVHQQLPLQSPTFSAQIVMVEPGEVTALLGILPASDQLRRLPAFDEAFPATDFFSRLLRPPRH